VPNPDDTKGPVVMWEYFGPDGWHPKSFATVHEAVVAGRYNQSEFIVTRPVEFDVVERSPSEKPRP
jgi:hypothetical protein